LSRKITYDPAAIREVGETVCPDLANYYDDIASKASEAGRARASAFGNHALGETWDKLFKIFYDVVYETGQNTRAMGRTLIEISEDQEILEGELSNDFGRLESEIDAHGYTATPSEHYREAPPKPPAPQDLGKNPYASELGGPHAAF
jgi:hypothetical protein